jgi:predicted N-acetyltransferase YhbS
MRYVSRLERPGMLAAARHTLGTWGGGRSYDGYVAALDEQLERACGDMRYVALVDEQDGVVSSLKRYRVGLMAPSGPLEAVGIGAVFTPQEHRRRGHAATLLRALMEEARAEGLGAAMLFSDIDPAYYERLGFVTLPHLSFAASARDLPAAGALECEATEDVGLLLPLFERSWEGPWLRAARTEASWRYWSWRNGAGRSVLLHDRGRAAGYVTVSTDDETLWIDDVALLEAPVGALWATVRRLAAAADCDRVAGWLRADHAVAPFTGTARRRCIPMLAPLDRRLADVRAVDTHFAMIDHF